MRSIGGADALLTCVRHDALQFVGSGDYERVGAVFLDYFIKLGGLEPRHRVLDIGCGVGRMAVPLTGYLSNEGSYEGVDIVPEGIEWCTNNLSTRFSFPVFCGRHSQQGIPCRRRDGRLRLSVSISGRRFRFRVPHLGVYAHAAEGGRELSLGDFATAEARRSLLHHLVSFEPGIRISLPCGRAALAFKHSIEGCLITNPDVPEEAIAHPESVVRAWYQAFGLDKDLIVHYGAWCGRERFESQQDICVSAKRA